MDECIKRIWRSRGVEGPRADRGLQVTEGMDSEAARLQHINETIVASRDAFLGLQNQLAKSFHYIPEEERETNGEDNNEEKSKLSRHSLRSLLGKCARSLEHQQWIFYFGASGRCTRSRVIWTRGCWRHG